MKGARLGNNLKFAPMGERPLGAGQGGVARGVSGPAPGDSVPRYVWARLCRARP